MIICVSAVHTGVGAGLYPKHISVWRLPPREAGGQVGVALGERHPPRRRLLQVAAGRRPAARAVGPAAQPAAADREADQGPAAQRAEPGTSGEGSFFM